MDSIGLSEPDFKALSSTERRKILGLLNKKNCTLTELSKDLGISLTSTKKHIEKLRETGLITPIEDNHKWIYYSLTEKGKSFFNQENYKFTIILALIGLGLLLAFLFGIIIATTILEKAPFNDKPNAQISPPENLKYEVITNLSAVAISWNKPETDLVLKFDLLRKEKNEIAFTKIASDIVGTEYIDKKIEENKSYDYIVIAKAVTESGSVLTSESEKITVEVGELAQETQTGTQPQNNPTQPNTEQNEPQDQPTSQDNQDNVNNDILMVPTNLVAEYNSDNPTHILVFWQTTNNAKYRLFRKISENDFRLIADNITTNYFNDYNILENFVHYYKVKAYNDLTESEFSETINVFVPQNDQNNFSAPSIPQNLFASFNDTNTTINITWNASTGTQPIIYNLYRMLEGETAFYRIDQNITVTNFIDSNIFIGKSHYYKIKAANNYGESDFSQVFELPSHIDQNVMTAPSTPQNLSGFKTVDGNFTTIHLTWNPSSGTQPITYEVFFKRLNTPDYNLLQSNIVDANLLYTIFDNNFSSWYKVRAVNNVGTSQFSNEIYIW